MGTYDPILESRVCPSISTSENLFKGRVIRLNKFKHKWVMSPVQVSCSLNFLQGGYIGDYRGALQGLLRGKRQLK